MKAKTLTNIATIGAFIGGLSGGLSVYNSVHTGTCNDSLNLSNKAYKVRLYSGYRESQGKKKRKG